jgi:hypothetical protein
MTTPIPFLIDPTDKAAVRFLMDRLNDPRFLEQTVAVPLSDAPGPLGTVEASWEQSQQRTVPLWSPSVTGRMVRRVRLSSGANLHAQSAGRPFVTLTVKIRGTRGTHTLGTFDSRTQRIMAGTPVVLTNGEIDRLVNEGEEIVVLIDQRGMPKVSLAEFTFYIDTVYSGA